jgi:hypothetical protein
MSDTPTQLSYAVIQDMSAEEVRDALAAGEFDSLLRGEEHPASADADRQLSRDDVKTMTPEQVRDALDSGKLDELLGRT